jgi:hypothetical protein
VLLVAAVVVTDAVIVFALAESLATFESSGRDGGGGISWSSNGKGAVILLVSLFQRLGNGSNVREADQREDDSLELHDCLLFGKIVFLK